MIVTDSNDNEPVFDFELYRFQIAEDASPGELVGKGDEANSRSKQPNWTLVLFSGLITATDYDSGRFGQVEYALKGFGAERFDVNTISGEIFVKACGDESDGAARNCLDFESQRSYALTYTAADGGGQVRNGMEMNALTVRRHRDQKL